MKNNRKKILETAFRLFNEKSTAEVSTNHICEALAISPGNLYYHFKSKDDIIVALFEDMIAQWNDIPQPPDISGAGLTSQLEQALEFLWQYRFIHREIPILYHRIEKFRTIFNEIQKKRLEEIGAMMEQYARAGVLKFSSKEEADNLARSIWFFFLYWLSYLETEGNKITKKTLSQSLAIVQLMIRPYLNESRTDETFQPE